MVALGVAAGLVEVDESKAASQLSQREKALLFCYATTSPDRSQTLDRAPRRMRSIRVAFEIVLSSRDHGFGVLDGRVMVQVRKVALDLRTLEVAIDKALPVLLAAPGPIGLISVVDGDGGVTPLEVVARQKHFLGGLLGRKDAWLATVLTGTSVQAVAVRASGRVMMLGTRSANIKHAHDVDEGVAWLAGKLGDIPASALRAALAELAAVMPA